jgi:hypothetical protein
VSFLCIPLSGFAKETKSHAPKKYAENKSKKPIKFKCDGRQHCSQMRSFKEAKYFIQHCPNTKMDGDNDGIPCEGYKKDR